MKPNFPERRKGWTRAVLTVSTILLACSVRAETNAPHGDDVRFWPQWRGPLANGVAPHANPPTIWSEKKNIRWKLALAGQGHSSPVVYGDRIYVMAAAPVGEAQKP